VRLPPVHKDISYLKIGAFIMLCTHAIGLFNGHIKYFPPVTYDAVKVFISYY